MMTIRYSVDLLLAMARDGEEFTAKDGRKIRVESNVPADAQLRGGGYRQYTNEVVLYVDGDGDAKVTLYVDEPQGDDADGQKTA